MGMKPCPGCGMPRDEKQLGKVPCPICSLSPPPPAVDPDPEGWGVDDGPRSEKAVAAAPRLPRPGGGGGWRVWGMVAGVLAVAAGVAVGAAVLLRGGTGQLMVTGGEDGVEVAVSKDGKEVAVVSPAAKKPIDLRPGTYGLAVKGAAGAWKVDGERVTVARGEAAVARVERARADVPAAGSPAARAGPELVPPPGAGEVPVTGAATLTAASFGKSHVCSGTAADYTVTLPNPAGNAGRSIWFRMSPALTRLVTLNAGTGATIDGQQTRVMWAQEAALLVTDGANWFKVAGKTRPMGVKIQRQGADVPVPENDYAPATFPTFVSGVRAMFDGARGRATVVRPGTYTAVGFAYAAEGSGSRLAVGVAVNAADNKTAANNGYSAAGIQSGATFVNTFECAAGDYIGGWYFAFGGDILVLGTTAGSYPQLVVTEVPSW